MKDLLYSVYLYLQVFYRYNFNSRVKQKTTKLKNYQSQTSNNEISRNFGFRVINNRKLSVCKNMEISALNISSRVKQSTSTANLSLGNSLCSNEKTDVVDQSRDFSDTLKLPVFHSNTSTKDFDSIQSNSQLEKRAPHCESKSKLTSFKFALQHRRGHEQNMMKKVD